jgi:hypothetical protein
MKTTIILLASAAVYAQNNCDSATVEAKINPIYTDPSVAPCVADVGANCFRPTDDESPACAQKFVASKQCEAAWPTLAKAFASISPPCEYGGTSTAELGQASWAQFLASPKIGTQNASSTPPSGVTSPNGASAVAISAIAGFVALVATTL